MSYLGKTQLKASDVKRFNVTGSTSATHTLTWTTPNEQSLFVTINGVKQQEDAYSIAGSPTVVTLTSALVTTDKLEIVGIVDVGETTVPGSNTVDTASIQNDAVTNAKMADDAVGIAELSATGTASETTYLRGNNTWATVESGRNYIINGNFDVWQRGTAFTTNNVYTADRWKCYANPGTGNNYSRQTFTPGQTDVPNFPKYYLRYLGGTTVSGTGEINQYVEDVTRLGGKEVTVSLWAKASSGTPNLGLVIYQAFGSGGSGNNTSYDSSTTWTLSTTWTKYTLTHTISSISGKTIGTGTDTLTAFRFKTPDTASLDIDIAQVQVELGSVATPFEQKSYAQELQDCLRYFEKESLAQTYMVSNGDNAGFMAYDVNWGVKKRGTPTVTFSTWAVYNYITSLGDETTPNSWSVAGTFNADSANIGASKASHGLGNIFTMRLINVTLSADAEL